MKSDTGELLPDLGDFYTLKSAQIEAFQEKGYCLLRQCLSTEEVHAYHEHIGAVVEGRKLKARGGVYQTELEDRDLYHRAFVQIENLWEVDEGVKKFSLAKRFGKIAADLMGVDCVRMYHDQALVKEPGGGHTPWHQDQYYWPLDSDKTVTMWLALQDVSIEMGSLVFADGTQALGPLEALPISAESDHVFRDEVIRRECQLVVHELSAGDTTWHSGWTLHKAPGNSTQTERSAMTVIYIADGTRVSEFSTEKHEAEAERWMPARRPGDRVDTELNPIVYSG